ncbi:DUF1156 domain-containing protein [Selenomonas ruminantium]|uniref:Adenine-specific DNA methylase, contains a Zn-ribbon domain n=1 Tax=Selenomonas ruminantium TaxID=971 RepID=A0A1H0MQQ2_SELRU|nr:DUF1156 domain-containing protein [Selenomonas ruminantium]SDO82674.1 Adenine-specific DNA methylase, contains a Zn-ribbon domain [Selenomonas ruminantium]
MEYQQKLIEGKFPCQQVGAETNRELAVGKQPPVQRLHVWWARRPLTPSRAAVLGSILPADTNPEVFLKDLGIVKKQAVIGNKRWTLVGKNLELIERDGNSEYILVTEKLTKAIAKENRRRDIVREKLFKVAMDNPLLRRDETYKKWLEDVENLTLNMLATSYDVKTVAANPAATNERLNLASSQVVRESLGNEIRLDDEDRYGYSRAYSTYVEPLADNDICILDPTAGGGSIPFEALRLGGKVIANDLNPVATGIQYATLRYPSIYGMELLPYLEKYGDILCNKVRKEIGDFFKNPVDSQNDAYLYCREITCPHCGERAPLLNSFALAKKKDGWMVVPKIEGITGHKKVRFVPVRLVNGKGPNGENPEEGTVKKGTGRCLHCGQAIDSEEIKRQARGESDYGTWQDKLYCVVGVRLQPKKDKAGNIMRYASGAHKGEIRTEKVTFFREPTEADFAALQRAEEKLKENWNRWEDMDLIPTEKIPEMNDNRPRIYGMERWCDMFTARQLLGHLTAMETLRDMSREILAVEGQNKGTAIVHYLQYMIDKCLDYNSRQTRWEYTRSVVKGTFGRHDFSLKWTFGELIYGGENSGLAWGKSQVLDAYKGICGLLEGSKAKPAEVLHGSAANLSVEDKTVDIICVDPPYYNNVQYAELSDYFYVWQKRTFGELYPDIFNRRLTNKRDEAVANPVRDGSAKEANAVYEQRMGEIFAECRRVLKDDGILTMMFTHKTQDAWETLTRSLVLNGWNIASTFPVESEGSNSMHQKDMAAAATSIFIACRKRDMTEREPAIWTGFGGTGVRQLIHKAVEQSLQEFAVLKLNAVDEMVASYGSALKVLSEHWPVMDGDELVSPTTAMREASTVVAQYQMSRISGGQMSINDLKPEAGIALTMLGIYGTGSFAYDDALSLSKSLNIRLENKVGGYHEEDAMIGINDESGSRSRRDDEEEGYYAPVVKKGSKLRLVLPEERNHRRLANPQQEWDIVQGMIMAYREGDIPVARAYLQKHGAGSENKLFNILQIWADNCGSEDLRKETQRLIFGLKA